MCRLPQPSIEVRKLGKHLTQTILEHGELSFVVWEQTALRPRGMDRQLLPPRVIEEMVREQRFDMARFVFEVQNKVVPIHINLCFGDLTMFPISGYPRPLFTDMTSDSVALTHSQTNLSSFPTGSNTFTRAASRYTHGSRRLKKVAAWEPPALLERVSLTDLRSYGDPDRVIGSDVIKQGHAYAEQRSEGSLPEALGPKAQDAAHQRLAPQQLAPPQTAPRQSRLEQVSTRSTLLNAFRALLWPIRARPPKNDPPGWLELEGDDMSQFWWFKDSQHRNLPGNRDGQVWEDSSLYAEQGSYTSDSPHASPPTMHYYHVDSAENEIYQHWVGLLSPNMGRWMPLTEFGPGLNRQRQDPHVAGWDSNEGPVELSGDSSLAVELP